VLRMFIPARQRLASSWRESTAVWAAARNSLHESVRFPLSSRAPSAAVLIWPLMASRLILVGLTRIVSRCSRATPRARGSPLDDPIVLVEDSLLDANELLHGQAGEDPPAYFEGLLDAPLLVPCPTKTLSNCSATARYFRSSGRARPPAIASRRFKSRPWAYAE